MQAPQLHGVVVNCVTERKSDIRPRIELSRECLPRVLVQLPYLYDYLLFDGIVTPR